MPVINSIDDMVKVAQEKMDHKIEVDIFEDGTAEVELVGRKKGSVAKMKFNAMSARSAVNTLQDKMGYRSPHMDTAHALLRQKKVKEHYTFRKKLSAKKSS